MYIASTEPTFRENYLQDSHKINIIKKYIKLHYKQICKNKNNIIYICNLNSGSKSEYQISTSKSKIKVTKYEKNIKIQINLSME